MFPPETACVTPVVLGKEIGKPNNDRTAKKAYPWEDKAFLSHPKTLAVSTRVGDRALLIFKTNVGFREPPPDKIHKAGLAGRNFSAATSASAMKAVKVAAPFAGADPST